MNKHVIALLASAGSAAISVGQLPGIAQPAHIRTVSSACPTPSTNSLNSESGSSWELKPSAKWMPCNLKKDEQVILEVLCRLTFQSYGWSSARLNAAISVMSWGSDPPDSIEATVYKTCNYAGGLSNR